MMNTYFQRGDRHDTSLSLDSGHGTSVGDAHHPDYINTPGVEGLQLAGPPDFGRAPPLPPRLRPQSTTLGPRQLGQPRPQLPLGFSADQPQPGPSVPQPGSGSGSGSGADLINFDLEDDEDYDDGSAQGVPGAQGEQHSLTTDKPWFEPLAVESVRAPAAPFSVFVQIAHNDPTISRRYFWMESCQSQRVVSKSHTLEDYYCKVNLLFVFLLCDCVVVIPISFTKWCLLPYTTTLFTHLGSSEHPSGYFL